MPTDPLTRALVVAETTLFGTLRGTGGLGLAGAASAFPLLVLAIASASFNGLDLLAAAETLFSTLFLPVILLLVCLVQGVSLFRTELEEDTLLYPMKRTIPRPSVVVGKYLGFLASTLLALLPSALIGFAIAAALGHGPTRPSLALTEAAVLLTLLGVVAYGAIFLFLGLFTRSALVIGLVYGFLWETFVSLLPGPIGQWTVVYYLRSIGTSLLPSVDWGGGAPNGSVLVTSAGIVLFAVGSLVVASAYLRYMEIRPAAAPT